MRASWQATGRSAEDSPQPAHAQVCMWPVINVWWKRTARGGEPCGAGQLRRACNQGAILYDGERAKDVPRTMRCARFDLRGYEDVRERSPTWSLLAATRRVLSSEMKAVRSGVLSIEPQIRGPTSRQLRPFDVVPDLPHIRLISYCRRGIVTV